MSKNEELKNLIDQHYREEEYYCYDGIVNEETFENAKIKILWVLKEAYIKEDTREEEQKIASNKNWYLSFLRKYSYKPIFSEKTWHPIIYASYGILNKKEWNDIPYIVKKNEIANVLHQIAVINIKKVPNIESKTSNLNELKNNFISNFELINNQINIIKPNVVIWGFWNLGELDLFKKEFVDPNTSPYGNYYPYKKVNNILHVLVDHPAAHVSM